MKEYDVRGHGWRYFIVRHDDCTNQKVGKMVRGRNHVVSFPPTLFRRSKQEEESSSFASSLTTKTNSGVFRGKFCPILT